jgi:hypothetical protein
LAQGRRTIGRHLADGIFDDAIGQGFSIFFDQFIECDNHLDLPGGI